MLHGAGIFTNIYPKNCPNVGKYSVHGALGPVEEFLTFSFPDVGKVISLLPETAESLVPSLSSWHILP